MFCDRLSVGDFPVLHHESRLCGHILQRPDTSIIRSEAMPACAKMSQLLRMYEAVLDALYHQVTLYGLVVDFWDDIGAVNRARTAVENSHEMMLGTRRLLDTHMLEHGCGPP